MEQQSNMHTPPSSQFSASSPATESTETSANAVASKARGLVDNAQGLALSKLDEGKQRLVDQVGSIGNAARSACDALRRDGAAPLANALESAAGRVDQVGDYLRRRGSRELVADAKQTIRAHPAMTFGIVTVAGLLIGRFLRSAEPFVSEDLEGDVAFEPEPSLSGDGVTGSWTSSPSTSRPLGDWA